MYTKNALSSYFTKAQLSCVQFGLQCELQPAELLLGSGATVLSQGVTFFFFPSPKQNISTTI
jgi:hypothetical protein